MSEKDGGAAFPIQGYENGIFGGANVIKSQGMSLRDFFAAQALKGIAGIAAKADKRYWNAIAAECYEAADAMLAERAKS